MSIVVFSGRLVVPPVEPPPVIPPIVDTTDYNSKFNVIWRFLEYAKHKTMSGDE